jgi:hypothetical protein
VYELEVILSGDTATLEVGGVKKVSHTFASGIDGGPVGLRLANAHTHFDDVYVQEVVSERKYYFFGGRRVAMRRDGMIQYIVADHVCSACGEHVCLPCGKHMDTSLSLLRA